jgi:hypothetical protein
LEILMLVDKQTQAERAAGVACVARLVNYVVIEVAADGTCKPVSFKDGGRLDASWAPMPRDQLLRKMPQILGEAVENAGGPPYVPAPATADQVAASG